MTKRNKNYLPKNWSFLKVSDCGKICSGGTPDTNNPQYWDGNIKWITPSEVSKLKTRYISKTERNITSLGVLNSSATVLPPNSLIVCTRATIGSCCINKVELSTNQGFKSIIPNSKINIDFIYYLLSFNKNDVVKKACGSTFLEISKKDFENLKILVPPIEEQKRIAEVLSTWDEGIENLEKLIALKEKQKRALMQRLLTGKTCLKGFSTPWKEVRLSEILIEHKLKSTGVESVFSVSVHKGLINQIEHLGRSFSAQDTSNYNLVREYDIVYTKSPTGDFPWGIIKQSYVKEDVIVSPLYGVFQPKSIFLGIYLDHYFESNINTNNVLYPLVQKGAKNTINITNSTFLKGKIYLPQNEQEIEYIARFIIESRNEISQLKNKLEVFKKQKKYLMQQLLTGKKRLV